MVEISKDLSSSKLDDTRLAIGIYSRCPILPWCAHQNIIVNINHVNIVVRNGIELRAAATKLKALLI